MSRSHSIARGLATILPSLFLFGTSAVIAAGPGTSGATAPQTVKPEEPPYKDVIVHIQIIHARRSGKFKIGRAHV